MISSENRKGKKLSQRFLKYIKSHCSSTLFLIALSCFQAFNWSFDTPSYKKSVFLKTNTLITLALETLQVVILFSKNDLAGLSFFHLTEQV